MSPRLDHFVPERAIAIYAHPDDPEVSCGGTLAKWTRKGASVHLALLNRGEKGSADPGVDPDWLAGQRAVEVAAAAAVMGLSGVDLFGIDDGESENDITLRARLVALVRRLQPQAVVCPDPTALYFGDGWVNHRDHRVCGIAVLDAVAPAAASPHYFPEAGAAHQVERIYLTGTLEPDTAVEISDVLDVKARALGCHRTQLGSVGELVDELVVQRAKEAGELLGVPHAETFRVLRLAG